MIEAYYRAKNLVGCPFKPFGRDPKIGVDCIGLAAYAFAVQAYQIPPYGLSDGSWHEVMAWVQAHLSAAPVASHSSGDLLVIRLPRCFHFAVVGDGTMVHADLRARRVVEGPLTTIKHKHVFYRSSIAEAQAWQL